MLPLVATLLGIVALLLLGALAGYRFASSRARDARAGDTVVLEGADDGPLAESAAAMPDLRNLERDAAIEALADAGVDTSKITETTKPYVGAPGRVISQEPPRGTADPKDVSLVLSTAATVPADLVGKDAKEAVTQLGALGVVVRQRPVYRPGTAPGTVLASTPAPGAALTETIDLDVSEKASSMFLTELEPSESDCQEVTDALVTGVTVSYALVCPAREIYDGEVQIAATYELGGKADQLKATVAIDGGSDATTSARVVVRIDGKDVWNQVVAFSQPLALDIPLTGASQLQIFVSEPAEDTEDWPGADVILANPTIYGSPDALDQLGAGT